MKAHRHAKPFPGPKLYQQRAEVALPLLVRQAFAQHDVTYQDLAREMGMANHRNLNYVLGSVGFALVKLGRKWGEKIPPIQTLVVNKKTRLPGSGGRWFAAGARHQQLDPAALKLVILERHAAVFKYPKWRDVLRHFNLPEVETAFADLHERAAKSGRGGPESQRHIDLKNEIAQKPWLAGLKFPPGGTVERPIPSGDELDVCFESNDALAGVEVKSLTSDEADLARGLYQAVKYEAVLTKWVAFQRKRQLVSVVLVVEGTLPNRLLALRNALGVRVVELKRVR